MSHINFDETLVLKNIEGENSSDILKYMAANLYNQGFVKASYAEAVVAREKKFATGLPTGGYGVAIPHTDIEHVNQSAISVGILKKPVDFGIMGEETEKTPVKLVFMLAMHDSHSQLSMLQSLMGIFQDEEVLTYLATEESEAKIKDEVVSKLNLSIVKGGEQK
ncbi:PTS sugar transporter subunit IIA [Pelosinus sp. IPA-1]|uniref:PTS sugar transporter subunit IIA n=1 Tax=Pelosinus sp. IPA-1 TaxID=3029569 RepID=UPI0024361A85|nr:PTS sugar transporter subunit IIA [Pelosinus sp. IPA-1]GMB01175.1 PTS galactitol transporter subunit IIA [Pelosinus sp. IPA-1]